MSNTIATINVTGDIGRTTVDITGDIGIGYAALSTGAKLTVDEDGNAVIRGMTFDDDGNATI